MKKYIKLFLLIISFFIVVGCSETAEVCDADHLSLCTQESTCSAAGGLWDGDSCHSDTASSNSTSNWDEMDWDSGQWK